MVSESILCYAILMTDPKQKFIDAAAQLFARRGLHGVSLADVAGTLNLSKQAILYHFKTKERLYSAVLSQAAARCEAVLQDVHAADLPAADRVGHLIKTLHAHMLANPADARLIARELADNPDRLDSAKTLPFQDFLNGAVDIVQSHPAAQALGQARMRAATYQLIGANNYHAIPGPTLSAIWGDAAAQEGDAGLLPVPLDA